MELRELLNHLPDGEMMIEAERDITFCFIRHHDDAKILAYRNGATVYEDECSIDDMSFDYVKDAVRKINKQMKQHHCFASL